MNEAAAGNKFCSVLTVWSWRVLRVSTLRSGGRDTLPGFATRNSASQISSDAKTSEEKECWFANSSSKEWWPQVSYLLPLLLSTVWLFNCFRAYNALTIGSLSLSAVIFIFFIFKLDLHFQRPVGRLPRNMQWWSEVAVVLIHWYQQYPHPLKFWGPKTDHNLASFLPCLALCTCSFIDKFSANKRLSVDLWCFPYQM